MDLPQYVGTLNLLGDESRIRLCALLRERELSVGDLVRVTGMSQSRVSTHLARLKEGLGLSEILLCSTKTGFGLKELWAQILTRAEENADA